TSVLLKMLYVRIFFELGMHMLGYCLCFHLLLIYMWLRLNYQRFLDLLLKVLFIFRIFLLCACIFFNLFIIMLLYINIGFSYTNIIYFLFLFLILLFIDLLFFQYFLK